MAKKKKVRVDLRKNRSKPPRQQQWTRGFHEHGFEDEATAQSERVRAKPPSSWQAYDCYLQAVDALASFNASLDKGDLYEARRLVQQSLAIDPTYARSYAILARTYDAAWVHPFDGDHLNPSALDQAHQLARKAVQLDANLPLAHACLGVVLTYRREHDASIAEFERAIALNPNYVDWPFGMALVLAGDSRRAIDVLKAYMRLDPFYAPIASGLLGSAHYTLKQYSQAMPLLRNYVSRTPKARWGHVWLAATYAQMGKLAEARAAPGGATAVPARLTTQVEVILGDKSPIAMQRCTTSGGPKPSTPDGPGSYRLGSRLVRHAEPAAVATSTGSASTPERRLPAPYSNCAGRRPTEPPGKHPQRPRRRLVCPPRLFTGHSESVC